MSIFSFRKVPVFAEPSIRNFFEKSKQFDETYNQNKTVVFGDNFVHFTLVLANSISAFYAMTNKLYEKKYQNNLSKGYKESRFYSFYTDEIASNPSTRIFTETPRVSELDPFPVDVIKIANLSKHLFDTLPSKRKVANNILFNKFFQDFYATAFTYYDFTFDSEKSRGVFNKFEYNEEAFNYINNAIRELVFSEEDKSKYKEKINRLLRFTIQKNLQYLKEIKDIDLHIEENDYESSEIYKKYVDLQIDTKNNKQDVLKFELFTYILVNKLWKVERIFQRTPEYIKEDSQNALYMEKTKRYLIDSLNDIKQLYSRKLTLGEYFEKVYKNDKIYIDKYVLTELLEDVADEPMLMTDQINEAVENSENNIGIGGVEYINNSINYMIKNEKKEKFKFYRLFEESKNPEEMILLLQTVYSDIETKIKEKNIEDHIFVGVLRSGSFLAHAMNILRLYDQKSKGLKSPYAHFMITHPYLSILPRALSPREDAGKELTAIFIDEAIKSGYSVSIADSCRERTLFFKGIKKSDKDFAYSLVDFSTYKSGRNKDGIETHHLVDIDTSGEGELNITIDHEAINKKLPESLFNWKDFFLSLGEIDKEDMQKKIIELSKVNINRKERIDLVRPLVNSEYLFWMCYQFASDLILKTEQKEKQIVFYPGSPEGKLIADTIAFVMKIAFDYKGKMHLNGKDFGEEDQNVSNSFLIYTDLSLVSGSTQDYIWNLDVQDRLKGHKEIFDQTYVIYCKDPRRWIPSKYIFMENDINEK